MAHQGIELNGKTTLFSHFQIEVVFCSLISIIKKNRYTELEDAVNEWEHGLRHISVGLVDGNNLSLNPYFSESSEAQRLLTLVSKAIDLLDHVEADPMPVESLNQLYGTDIATESGKMPKQVIRDAFDIVNVLVNK